MSKVDIAYQNPQKVDLKVGIIMASVDLQSLKTASSSFQP